MEYWSDFWPVRRPAPQHCYGSWAEWLFIESTWKRHNVILSEAKEPEILRSFAPQNDTQELGFRLDTNLSAAQHYGADPAD